MENTEYKALSAFEQIDLQKQNANLQHQFDRRTLMLYVSSIIVFVIGCLLGSIGNQVTKDSANEWFQAQDKSAQIDFMIASLDNEHKRAIAEHFCSLNPTARDICANAKLIRPVK